MNDTLNRVQNIQVLLDSLISRVPTGDLRNVLTKANLLLNLAQSEVMKPGTIAKVEQMRRGVEG